MKTIITFITIIFAAITAIAQPRGEQAIFDATATSSYIDYGKGMNLNGYQDINGGSKLTITVWMKWDAKSVAGSWANIFTLNDSTNNGDKGVFWLQHSQTNNKIEFALTTKEGNRTFIQSTTNPQEGVWYHVACVFDGTLNTDNMKLYVNGILEKTATTKNSNPNSQKIANFSNLSKLYAGRWAFMSSTRNFDGMLDELSIWSKALTSTEINTILNNPESLTGVAYNAAKLVGYYNFDNGSTTDLSDNGNNGVTGGAVVFTNNGSLPVELVTFDVTNQDGKIILNWATATETNNNYFTIERSIDGINSEVIGIVKGAGNSNNLVNYNFVDETPNSGLGYYRIKQTDFDATTETFDWKSVNVSSTKESKFSVYPNPTTGNVNIVLTNAKEGASVINVVDLTGKVIYNQTIEGNEVLTSSFDLPSELTAGIYFVQITNNNTRFVEKLILK